MDFHFLNYIYDKFSIQCAIDIFIIYLLWRMYRLRDKKSFTNNALTWPSKYSLLSQIYYMSNKFLNFTGMFSIISYILYRLFCLVGISFTFLKTEAFLLFMFSVIFMAVLPALTLMSETWCIHDRLAAKNNKPQINDFVDQTSSCYPFDSCSWVFLIIYFVLTPIAIKKYSDFLLMVYIAVSALWTILVIWLWIRHKDI